MIFSLVTFSAYPFLSADLKATTNELKRKLTKIGVLEAEEAATIAKTNAATTGEMGTWKRPQQTNIHETCTHLLSFTFATYTDSPKINGSSVTASAAATGNLCFVGQQEP